MADGGAPLRIALVNWTDRVAGGAESYLRDLIPHLERRGHELAVWSEGSRPAERPPLAGPAVTAWCAETLGTDRAVEALRAWRPSLLFVHGVEEPDLEEALLGVAPAAVFVHTYRGTCVSGEKAFKLPTARPCHRQFGPACLAMYYPRRCGGLNPLTMLHRYRLEARRLELLRRYAIVITASDHMRGECLQHGLPADRLHALPLPVPAHAPGERTDTDHPHRLVWVGRMERPKGGIIFLDAAREAAAGLGRRLVVRMLGDGRERRRWETRAKRLEVDGHLTVRFHGWLDQPAIERVLLDSDLLVLSSVWPEPFGRVGLEAGRFGVPTAAFAVGGIPEWLEDGTSGALAPGEPPTARGLAAAIVRCLQDPQEHARLRVGARAHAEHWSFARHAARLDDLLRRIGRHG